MNNKNQTCIFTQEELNHVSRIWECVALSITDIRHQLISPEDALCNYFVPSHTFLFTSGGNTEILLNYESHEIKRFGLFHISKGTCLSIQPCCDWLEYYMIFYKAGNSYFNKNEIKNLLTKTNPFLKNYGFAPSNPIFISELLRQIYENWNQPTSNNRLYKKSLFYQFLSEVSKDLGSESLHIFSTDVVQMAIRYMNQNYSYPIQIQDMCDKIGISYSHFYRLIKKTMGISPQAYLSKVRLDKARYYLTHSHYSLSEIAKFTGFYDEFHLSSTFKKVEGISPIVLRKNLTWDKKYTYMETYPSFHYNMVSHNKPNIEGAYFMLKQFTNKTVIAAALSLMVLLSACATETINSSDDNTSTKQATVEQKLETNDEASTEIETRILSTKKGDVEIPVTPRRVITDCGLIGDVVALGIIPIAIEDYTSTDVAYQDLITDSKVLDKWEPEYIMAEEPDLILTVSEENYEKLSEIAPTIYIPKDELTVEEELSFLADALGKDAEEGKKLVTAFYEKAAVWKTKLEAAGFYEKTFSVIRVQGENKIGVRWSNNLGGQILFGALELPQTKGALKEIEAGQTWGDTLSFESLPDYMGDYILVTEYNNYDSIKDNAIWQALPAVQAGNIIIVSEPYMYLNDIYSWSAQLDLVGSELLKLANR